MTVSQAIFESFEPESSAEEDSEAEEDVDGLTNAVKRLETGEDDEEDESGTGVLTSQLRHFVIQVSIYTMQRESLADLSRSTYRDLYYST